MEKALRTVIDVIAKSPLDPGRAEPLYVQLAEKLASHIQDGLLKPGQQVPSEAALIEVFNISRVTVRQALLQLTRSGQLITKRGKGTYVARAAIQQDLTNFQGFREALQSQGVVPDTELLEFSTTHRRPSDDLPSALNLPVRLRRLYRVDGEAFAVVEAYLPLEAAAIGATAAAQMTVYDILQRHLCIRIGRADVGIQCAKASAKIAKELGLSKGSHILLMQRTSFCTAGTASEHMRIHIVPERYTFSMSVPGPMRLATGVRPG